ncbi:UvrD-helicase domain-containing protein [Pseudothioclava arenosa]|uniref:DNA 3'-5' helicase n=1 Tax=Pseudothioclava arenosa TaxID=1795308 RepID=A0A2A4CN68_9RHOB|nr:UvrD-helicase domain-containing protein [Pseudothioclava arenosa]PCD75554.1 hypothetical protein CLN94_13525 [Pseudothioclava arenosa]
MPLSELAAQTEQPLLPSISEKALLKMPFLATVETIVWTRGFGFLKVEGRKDEIFFHAKAALSNDQEVFLTLKEGDRLLCQVGSTPREPSKPASVLWTPVAGRDWTSTGTPDSQTELDRIRRSLFGKASTEEIGRIVAAGWYRRKWKEGPPTDLEDPVLQQVYATALAALSSEELTSRLHAAQGSPFAFVGALDPMSDVADLSALLATFVPSQLAAVCAPRAEWAQVSGPRGKARRLSEDHKVALLDWAVLSSAGDPERFRATWLKGDGAHEATFARQWLASGKPVPRPLLSWLMTLLEKDLLQVVDLRDLAFRDAHAGVVLYHALSDEDQARLQESWARDPSAIEIALEDEPALAGRLLQTTVLAVDLETDGARIHQLGQADHRGSTRLEGSSLAGSLQQGLPDLVSALTRVRLAVGHNAIGWDWPILSRAVPSLPGTPVWDTLLVAFLLEPQALSHALGGDHTADADARAALDLFRHQAERFDTSVFEAILTGRCSSTEELFTRIVDAGPDDLSVARATPAVLEAVDREQPLLLPDRLLRLLDWVPGYVIAPVDRETPLDPAFLEIRAMRLFGELTAAQRRTPVVEVLMAVLQRAQAQGISVRRNMLPGWLTERLPWLEAALDGATGLPDMESGCRVSPLPASLHWWAQAETWSGQAMLPDGPRMIVARAQAPVGILTTTPIRESTVLLDLAGGTDWAVRDPAADRLETGGSWRSFHMITVPRTITPVRGPGSPRTSSPLLVSRQTTVRDPGSRTQAGYWSEQLATLRSLPAESDAVPILLVGSTRSRTMLGLLETALAELGLGEKQPQHRSRREQLKRAAANGHCLVAGLDTWRAWAALAKDAGITLQPVVDAAPLEEWYALEAPAGAAQEEGPEDGPREISTSMVLDGIDKRVDKWLRPWLRDTGLEESARVPVLLDPRLEDTRHLTGGAFKRLAVELAPWTSEESQRLETVFAPLQIEREEAPSGMAAMEHFLVTHWQPSGVAGTNPVTGFKPTQLQAMEHIRDCRTDVMVTLPTGEGKSVLFQVPALARGLRNRRLTLVISPLRALMRDQVLRLHEQGFEESVDFLSGDQSREEQREVLQGVLDQRIVMLYVAPERLRVASFVDVLLRRIKADDGLEYIVFDEAHCINQWGYEFRPDYFFAFSFLMSRLRTGRLPEPTPVLLLSATLTASDRRRMRGLLEKLSQNPDRLPLAICPDPTTQVSPLRAHIRVRTRQLQGNIFETDGKALQERIPEVVKVIRTARRNVEETGQRSAVLVFVLSRSHADTLADQLTRETGQEVESFHAGLDGATREDIYDRFRSGGFDVLVATKAFGMGMDIPDIHWVVHLASPGYLEDYLQEVGRIGRGVREREKAGLDRLDALLLYSGQDFEAIRSMRAENELRVPQIDEIERDILKAVETVGDSPIAFVPQDGFSVEKYRTPAKRRGDATRLRLALHWLEEAGHVLQAGTVPDLLKIRFSPVRLKRVSEEDSLAGKVAAAILEATSNVLSERELALPELMQRILRSVGLRTGDDDERSGERKAVINLSRIRRHCRMESLDVTMSVIADLARREALTPVWLIDYTTRPVLSESEAHIRTLMERVTEAVRRLLGELRGTGRFRFDPHDWYDPAPFRLVDPEVRKLPRQSREQVELILREDRFRRSYINGFRTLARVVGIRLKQGLDPKSNSLYWQARCPDAEGRIAAQRLDHILPQAAALSRLFPPSPKDGSLEVADLITRMQEAHPAGTFHASDLSSLIRLLSSLGLVSTSPDLLPPSYVLQPQGRVPGLGQYPDLVEELDSVNRFAETRIFGMEVHANLPEDARDRFVPGYFACTDVDALKGFVDEQLGEIEDETGIFAEKRDQLRATRASEFFDFYRTSPEPAQWAAMQHPFDRNLLVNAGPGAGKTSVLVGRIVHLIREQHVKPSEIMVLAFNRAVVFEIRKRVRDLFRSLGYAAYASRVRVHTFHGLAMRHLGDTAPSEPEELLPTFARRMTRDAAFRANVAGECRALLVDEFQDVNEEVYEIIHALHAGSGDRAGVMAIGDDDQDILRWNRKPVRVGWGRPAVEAGGVFADHYFGRFRADFGGADLSELTLGVNFRSSAEIVEKSQEMINGFFDRRTLSRRLKTDRLRAVDGAPLGTVERIDARGWSWERTLEEVRASSRRLLSENPGSLAVLCRSNDEVASVHRALSGVFPVVTVQSSDNIAIRSLRHVALWLDLLEREIVQQDQALTDPLRARLLEAFHAETDIPETRAGGRMAPDLSVLWDLCAQETVFPYLSTLVEFLKDLRSDELQRLLGATRPEGEILVSTIHKVKGLEYDNVVVLPSRMSFGDRSAEIEADAAEEARLLYVALTRAKSRLVFHLGDREYSWAGKTIKKFTGAQAGGRILTGTPKEVFISWSMNRSHSNADPGRTQTYIETFVAVGDPILIEAPDRWAGKALMHQSETEGSRQIGVLSKAVGQGGAVTDLKVSAVIRYEPKPDDRAQPCPRVATQGWGYVVLVEGVLR